MILFYVLSLFISLVLAYPAHVAPIGLAFLYSLGVVLAVREVV